MGCDIHAHVEYRHATGAWVYVPELELFDYRNYNLFGWLAGVRNYSAVPPIAAPRRLPVDVSPEIAHALDGWGSDAHSVSWLSLEELQAFDYDAAVENRRMTVGNSGGHTADPGGGTMTTYREFLGTSYFADLERFVLAAERGPVRVVFWFDN